MKYKYEHTAALIKKKILNGTYGPGGKLPSIQTLAEELSLNADTVIRAYKMLESEHLIYAVAKSGYYVVKSINDAGETSPVIDISSSCSSHRNTMASVLKQALESSLSWDSRRGI